VGRKQQDRKPIPVDTGATHRAIDRVVRRAQKEQTDKARALGRFDATDEPRYRAIAENCGLRAAIWEGIALGAVLVMAANRKEQGND
jgi:hypothetical protein